MTGFVTDGRRSLARWKSGVFSLTTDDLKNETSNAPLPDTPRNPVPETLQNDQCCYNGSKTPNFIRPEALIFANFKIS
jgi:hypothetical protein